MHFDDTICAISTPQGVGGIAVIRVSGTETKNIVSKIFFSKHTLDKANNIVFGNIKDNKIVVDEVLVSIFNNPHSFTGEDIIEISCHGSKYIQEKILQLLIENGCRIAEAGEFSKRAFLNGKMDLSQTEAIADLIHSKSEISHRIAMQQMKGGFSKELDTLRAKLLNFSSLVELELDFSEEDVEFANRIELKKLIVEIKNKLDKLKESFKIGNAIKEGVPVAIVGNTNSGKSTLLNTLLNEEKAIVSNIHGTTRDVIEDSINIEGLEFRFIDTAGIRQTTDEIEKIGIDRTYSNIKKAQVIILVIDINESDNDNNKIIENIKSTISESQNFILVINKCDTVKEGDKQSLFPQVKSHEKFRISAKEKIGITNLTNKLTSLFNIEDEQNSLIVSNLRHYEVFCKSSESAQIVIEGLDSELSGDLLAMDIREIINLLGQITGVIDVEDILGHIFKNFCIGK